MAEEYSARVVKLVVYDSVLFNRNGQVRRWADGLARNYTENAIIAAPLNKRMNKGAGALPPGAMKASIRGDVDRIGPKFLQTTISVNVPYAMYVIGGTGPVIVADNKPYMVVPSNPGFGTRTRQRVVSGQRANNFLLTAHNKTARRHPSLRGLDDQVFRQF